jgi:hypothetical protein
VFNAFNNDEFDNNPTSHVWPPLVVLALTKPSCSQITETCSLCGKMNLGVVSPPVYFLFAYLRQPGPCIITNRSVWLKPERNVTHHELLRVSHPISEDLHRDVLVHNVLDPSSGIFAHRILRAPPRHLIVGVSTLGSSLFSNSVQTNIPTHILGGICTSPMYGLITHTGRIATANNESVWTHCHSWRFW